MEQSYILHPQHPEWPALDRALWRGPHPQHKRQHLPLQDHLLQGRRGPSSSTYPYPPPLLSIPPSSLPRPHHRSTLSWLLFQSSFPVLFFPFFPFSFFIPCSLIFPSTPHGVASSCPNLPSLPLWQARYWGSNVNEVQGAVFSPSGKVIHRLFGKWHEGLFRGTPPTGQCIWKPSKNQEGVIAHRKTWRCLHGRGLPRGTNLQGLRQDPHSPNLAQVGG